MKNLAEQSSKSEDSTLEMARRFLPKGPKGKEIKLTDEEKGKIMAMIDLAKEQEKAGKLYLSVKILQELKSYILSLSEIPRFKPDQIVKASEEFYISHGMKDWAEKIPAHISLSPDSQKKLKNLLENKELGFDTVLLIPPMDDEDLEEVAEAMFSPLSEETTGREGFWDNWKIFYSLYYNCKDKFKNFKIKSKERPAGPYLICFKNSAQIDELKSFKNFSEIRDDLERQECTGMTMLEYLFFQRMNVEQNIKMLRSVYTDDELHDIQIKGLVPFLPDTQQMQAQMIFDNNPPVWVSFQTDKRERLGLNLFEIKGADPNSLIGVRPVGIIPVENL